TIEQQLVSYVPLSALRALRIRLEKELSSRLNGVYTGYLGADMMICHFKDMPKYRIHPCVEINLRMTMGVVARLFYDRYMQPGMKGVFKLNYFSSPDQLATEDFRLSKEHPLRVSGEKITAGYLSLVPVTPHSQYLASILLYES
ncbi:MAG: hypothetical protein LBV64_06735, partial [Mediterranea sp.]|nr:hypothetical protein [Mediterranea sp.]